MGPDEMVLKDGVMLYYSDDGIIHSEPIPKPPMDYTIPELDLSYFDGLYTVGFDLAEGSDMTFSGTLILPYKKMSRKKFKKWLMSRGINRYYAEWFCKAITSFHGKKSYRSLYLYGHFASTPQTLFNNFITGLDNRNEHSAT